MRTERYHAETLLELLQESKVATMDQLQRALRTPARMTVHRKLKDLGYVTSYSHGSRFYTLERFAEFDENGLWSYEGIRFSVYGTLTQTAEEFVDRSDAGYFVAELDRVMGASTKKALQRLAERDRVAREWLSGAYLYCSARTERKTDQLRARRILASQLIGTDIRGGGASMDEIKAATILFLAFLDEKEIRLYAGLESLKRGYGGDTQVAEIFGIDPRTVARGRKELLKRDVDLGRIRKEGAGRPKKKRKS